MIMVMMDKIMMIIIINFDLKHEILSALEGGDDIYDGHDDA